MFAFFRRKPAPPKVIWLRGEARRDGLDVREKPSNLGELLETMAPAPFRLRLPSELPWPDLEAVLNWAWLERGYPLPTVVVESNPRFSLTVLDQAETFPELTHDYFSPGEIVQLELWRAVVATLPRFLHRDFVLAQAQAAGVDLDPRLLGRLSKYLRALLQAGWTLPPPSLWPNLAHSTPFDEIARGLETLQLRSPLAGPRRSQLVLQALVEPVSTAESLQAIEEFWVASAQVFPEVRLDPNTLLRGLLHNPRLTLQAWAQQNPDSAAHIVSVEEVPAPTLPRLSRLAMLAQDLSPEQRQILESYLGPLPQVLATPALERLACQRLGPQ